MNEYINELKLFANTLLLPCLLLLKMIHYLFQFVIFVCLHIYLARSLYILFICGDIITMLRVSSIYFVKVFISLSSCNCQVNTLSSHKLDKHICN